MKITKFSAAPFEGYLLSPAGDQQIYFDEFKVDGVCVQLYINGVLTSMLYFDQATEFYKAWRAYQCSI